MTKFAEMHLHVPANLDAAGSWCERRQRASVPVRGRLTLRGTLRAASKGLSAPRSNCLSWKGLGWCSRPESNHRHRDLQCLLNYDVGRCWLPPPDVCSLSCSPGGLAPGTQARLAAQGGLQGSHGPRGEGPGPRGACKGLLKGAGIGRYGARTHLGSVESSSRARGLGGPWAGQPVVRRSELERTGPEATPRGTAMCLARHRPPRPRPGADAPGEPIIASPGARVQASEAWTCAPIAGVSSATFATGC